MTTLMYTTNLSYLFRRQDGCHGGEWEVDARVGYKICLELVEVDVQTSFESQGSRYG